MNKRMRKVVRTCGLLCCSIALASMTAYGQTAYGDRGAEPGDSFGGAVARGDFDGDGFMDLAIGVPGEDITAASGQVQDAGAVEVIYGSQNGLNPNRRQFWTQATATGIPDVAVARFGFVLAAGDFNNDGYTDLAIGAPQETINDLFSAGAVIILYGSPKGLTAGSGFTRFWSQASPGIQGGPGYNNYFGEALAAGDFNHDGFADLAIGVPQQSFCSHTCQLTGRGFFADAGAVVVIYGSANGLSTNGIPSQFWSQDSPGILDAVETNDLFGYSLAAADFNGDGFADLAIGAYGQSVGGLVNAGAVNVIYGSASGLNATAVPNQFWTQNSLGGVDHAAAQNVFGISLAVGDFNGDGFADLAIGAPNETIGTLSAAGAVDVIYGSRTGLSATTIPSQNWNRDVPNILGTAEAGALFGLHMTAGDFNGDGKSDLVVGVLQGTVSTFRYAGNVNVIYGSSNGLSASDAPNQLWSQDSPGVLDQAETQDRFGDALAAGDFNGDGRDDLAVGVPNEGLTSSTGTISGAGAVNVIYGNKFGLDATAIANQLFTQIYTLPPLP